MWKLCVLLGCLVLIGNGFGLDVENVENYTVARIFQNAVEKYDRGLLDIDNAACVQQIRLLIGNMLNFTKDDFWALKMLDASGKLPAGILEANTAWVGRYEECLNIYSQNSDVYGKYCLVTFGVDNSILGNSQVVTHQDLESYKSLTSTKKHQTIQLALFPSLGICLPDQCNDVDVQTILSSALSIIPWNVTCQTKAQLEASWDVGAIFTVSYIGVFAGLVALSTIHDVYARYLYPEREPHPILTSFSAYTNGKKLFRVSKNSGEFSCLHGLRFFSLVWVVYGHTFYTILIGPLTNIFDVIRFVTKDTFGMTVVNAHFSVDTFLVITGTLVVYGFMKIDHQKHKFNPFLFYSHRYLRLAPAFLPVVLASIFLVKHMGSGPFYPQLDNYVSQPCRDDWYLSLLFVENYKTITMCNIQIWYLNIDWQMYLISPLFLLFLPKRPRIGLSIIVLLTAISIAFSFWETWDKNLIVTSANFYGNSVNYAKYYYMKTHTRAATWLMGGILGYVLARLKKNDVQLQLPKLLVVSIWLVVLGTIPMLVFAGRDTFMVPEYHRYSSAFFNAFARPAWALCIMWIILACSSGYGGVINKILSWWFFQVFNRLSYSIYVLHYSLLHIIEYSQKQPGYFSVFNLAYSFWGNIAIVTALSLFWTLTFESPIIVLESYMLRGGRRRPVVNNQVPNEKSDQNN